MRRPRKDACSHCRSPPGGLDFIVKGFKHEVMLATAACALERRRMVIRDQRLIQQLEAKIGEWLAIVREYAGQSPRPPRELHAS